MLLLLLLFSQDRVLNFVGDKDQHQCNAGNASVVAGQEIFVAVTAKEELLLLLLILFLQELLLLSDKLTSS